MASNPVLLMEAQTHKIKDGKVLSIRDAQVEDAPSILSTVQTISGESDYLTFGPGEFDHSLSQEESHLARFLSTDNLLFILGTIDENIVALLNFSAGQRPRVRHRGEVSMSVSKAYWGLGIGSLMLGTLIEWARASQIVKKIDLQVRTDNQRAISLYEGKSFVYEGTMHKELFLDGRYYDLHWMGLEL